MQTYEIAPDESMETLVRSLSRAVRKDKDLVLVIPAGNTLFGSGGAESIGKLGSIMRSYDARLQVQAADPSVVELFRAAGLKAGPLEANSAAPAAPAAAPQYPAAVAPSAVAPVPLQYTVAPAAPAPVPVAPAPLPQPLGGLSEDISNMNFDFDDVGVTPRAAAPPPPSPAPTQGGGGGFLSKLRNRMAQPDAPLPAGMAPPPRSAPVPTSAASNPPPAAPLNTASSTATAPSMPEPFDFAGMGLDATLPAGLTDTVAPAAGNRVVARMPSSNLDVTMSPMAGGDSTGGAGANPFSNEGDLPSWLADPAGGLPASATAAADPFGSESGLPSWLADPTAGSAALPSYGDSPDWLRAVGTSPASVPAAPVASAGPAPSAPPSAFAGLGGTPQSAESVGQAVQAAGLDARTRTLLLFGMALVRLAGAEANAAAQSARQAGCSDNELRLVVEMAQALGGGPSERLGKKILG